MAPVAGPEIEYTAGDKSKRNCIRAHHPLAMLNGLTITSGDEGCGCADDPCGSLHRGSGQAGATGGESDSRQGTNKDADDVNTAEDPMEFQVMLAKSRRELYGAGEESDDAGEGMRDEGMAVGDDLQPVGVVHAVVGDEKKL